MASFVGKPHLGLTGFLEARHASRCTDSFSQTGLPPTGSVRNFGPCKVKGTVYFLSFPKNSWI